MHQQGLCGEPTVVQAIGRALAERIGRDRFELWFGSQVRWRIDASTVRLMAPNSFVLDRLRRQFAPDIQLVIRTVCGAEFSAEFQVLEHVSLDASSAAAGVEATSGAAVGTAVANPRSIGNAERPSRSGPNDEVQMSASAARLLRVDAGRADAGNEEGRETRPRKRVTTLSDYVMGEGNRVAWTAAQSVVRRPGVVSPLFLYGPPGTGKSHLLEATCHATRGRDRHCRALQLSAEQFTCLFLEALQGSGLPNFRRKCREVDLLAIDDIQFLAGKKATLVEFQHTLDALARHGRQLVVTADRAPAELSSLGSELVTRLSGGLVCVLEAADYDTRLKLARQFAVETRCTVPDEVLRLIAQETSGDARQIRGALLRLRATSEACGTAVDLDGARRILTDVFAASQRMVRLPDVERAVCEVFGMESRALRDGNKTKAISQPRMLAMWLARKYTRAAFSEIGEYFGRRSHSTVISAERKVGHWMAHGAKLQFGRSSWPIEEAIRRIETKLRTG
ncbi:MAG: DnaA/Hda family protein [Pirellulaceae bacterium]